MATSNIETISFEEVLAHVGKGLNEEQTQVLSKFGIGIKDKSKFEIDVQNNKPESLKAYCQPWEPTNEGIIESYLLEVHGMKVDSGAASALKAKADNVSNNKSLEELGYEMNASLATLAFSNKGATRNKTAAATKQSERLQTASMISAEANAKKQEWIQWSQFALTQQDFKGYKQKKISAWESECEATLKTYEAQNQTLLKLHRDYESALAQIKTAKAEEIWDQIDLWLQSEKYEHATKYSKNFIEPLDKFMWGLGILVVLISMGFALIVMLPIQFFIFKDWNIGQALYSIYTGTPRFSSLGKGLPVVFSIGEA